jgi:DNA polymerase-3 subunit alpha
VAYRHERLEPILKETYGITVYQEQIMYTAMNLAGYTAAAADNLRKAVAKKIAGALHKERDRFIKGAVTNGIPLDDAHAIFDDWEAFARYGFNKGHAADYAVICVETAYLKAHYPPEYMTALLSVFKHDTDRVALYIADCRRLGIEVLPPDVNASGVDFEIEDGSEGRPAIRYGLAAIKNVGEAAVQLILDARGRDGPFTGLGDFARRVDLRQVGRRALESLARVGALDGLAPRPAALDALDRIMSSSGTHFRAAEVGQMSLFGAATGVADSLDLPTSVTELPRRQQLQWEKELLGVYVTDHPLTPYLKDLAEVVTHFSGELGEAAQSQAVCIAGEVTHLRPFQSRSGRPMAFLTVEDVQGPIEVIAFHRLWKDVETWIKTGAIVLVRGRVDSERGEPKVLADSISTEIALVGPKPSSPAGPPDPNGTPAGRREKEPVPAPEPVPAVWAEAASAIPFEVPAPVLSAPQEAAVEEAPSLEERPLREGDALILTVRLKSTGDRKRDALRMRRVHGLLTSYHGRDRFVFHVFEASRQYHLEFPNSTTGHCADLMAQLRRLLGEGMVRVERLHLQ